MGSKKKHIFINNRLKEYVDTFHEELDKRYNKKFRKMDIVNDIATYTGYTPASILYVMKGGSTSLELAFKVSQYFDAKIEEIFYIKEENKVEQNSCEICGEPVLAKGLCVLHYNVNERESK